MSKRKPIPPGSINDMPTTNITPKLKTICVGQDTPILNTLTAVSIVGTFVLLLVLKII